MFSERKFLDALVVVLGLWVVLSAIFLLSGTGSLLALWVQVGLGGAILMCAAWGQLTPKISTPEFINLILGLLLVMSPWVLGFAQLQAAAWNNWLVGGAIILLEALALPRDLMERTPHMPS